MKDFFVVYEAIQHYSVGLSLTSATHDDFERMKRVVSHQKALKALQQQSDKASHSKKTERPAIRP